MSNTTSAYFKQLFQSFKEDIKNGETSLICPKCKRKVRVECQLGEDYILSCGDTIKLPDKE